MKQSNSDFTKNSLALLMMIFLGILILIGPASTVMADNSIEAIIDVDPNVFDLEINEKWVFVYIEFPDTCIYDVGQIDVGSVTLSVNGYNISANPKNEISDYDLDDLPDLKVKFDARELQPRMFVGLEELTVCGTADGAEFSGSDTVTVVADGIASTILQTSDVHHHASGYGPYNDYTPGIPGDDGVTGGYARLATIIGGIKYQQSIAGVPTMLLDSGDFFMGTSYDLTAADPIALKFFTLLGYDAITLGNHEFDWSPSGLSMLLNAGLASGFNVPIVASNTITDKKDDGDNAIEDLMKVGAIVNKKVLELDNGIKVGLLGLMGENADEDAPIAAPITFNHDYKFVQACVDDLRENDEVDVVVVLSHTGVNSSGNGEDAEIAEHVSGIDIIASGHAHTIALEAFLRPCLAPGAQSTSIIFSPGEYGEFVSRLDFTYNKNLGRVVGYEYTLVPVDDTLQGNQGMQYMVDQYNAGINSSLSAAGLPKLGDTITTTGFDLEMGAYQPTGVTGLGSLCADSVRNVANGLVAYGGLDGIPVDVGIVPTGVVRDEIFKGITGRVTFSDVYNCLPLGISPDTSQPVPGYPMMHAYFTGMELYIIAEVGLTASQSFGSSYYLNLSGVKIDYNPAYAPYFQGVRSVSLYAPNDPFCTETTTPVDPTALYHGVIDLYAFQLLYVVNDFLAGQGLPTITPKDKNGDEITNYLDFRIDRDPTTEGTQELKEWMALLNYLPTFNSAPFAGIPSYIYGPGGAVENRIKLVTD